MQKSKVTVSKEREHCYLYQGGLCQGRDSGDAGGMYQNHREEDNSTS